MTTSTDSMTKKMSSVMQALAKRYGRKKFRSTGDPLSDILFILAAPALGEQKAHRAIKKLREHFVDGNELRVARRFEIRDVLATAMDEPRAEDFARRIVEVLREIFQSRGNLQLQSLLNGTVSEARNFFGSLTCLERHEAQTVLLVTLGKPVMPMNNEVLRVMRRLGFVSPKATAATARRAMEERAAVLDLYSCFRLLTDHARRTCLPDKPPCKTCSVRLLCDSRDQFV